MWEKITRDQRSQKQKFLNRSEMWERNYAGSKVTETKITRDQRSQKQGFHDFQRNGRFYHKIGSDENCRSEN